MARCLCLHLVVYCANVRQQKVCSRFMDTWRKLARLTNLLIATTSSSVSHHLTQWGRQMSWNWNWWKQSERGGCSWLRWWTCSVSLWYLLDASVLPAPAIEHLDLGSRPGVSVEEVPTWWSAVTDSSVRARAGEASSHTHRDILKADPLFVGFIESLWKRFRLLAAFCLSYFSDELSHNSGNLQV